MICFVLHGRRQETDISKITICISDTVCLSASVFMILYDLIRFVYDVNQLVRLIVLCMHIGLPKQCVCVTLRSCWPQNLRHTHMLPCCRHAVA